MNEKTPYRNAIRSRVLIARAFVELLNEREFEKITITDIAKRADINRGTFYAHFRGTWEVLSEIENEIISRMEDVMDNCGEKDLLRNPLPALSQIAEILNEDVEFFRMLISAVETGGFLLKLRDAFVERMMKDPTAAKLFPDRERLRMSMTFFAGGMIALFQAWFDKKIDMSLAEVVRSISEQNPHKK